MLFSLVCAIRLNCPHFYSYPFHILRSEVLLSEMDKNMYVRNTKHSVKWNEVLNSLQSSYPFHIQLSDMKWIREGICTVNYYGVLYYSAFRTKIWTSFGLCVWMCQIPQNLPCSVTLQPGPEDTGKACGVDYELRAFCAKTVEEKIHQRSNTFIHLRLQPN